MLIMLIMLIIMITMLIIVITMLISMLIIMLIQLITKEFLIIVIAPRVPPTLFRMFSVSVELHWVSISLALPLSLLRRARVEPPGISEDLAKQ